MLTDTKKTQETIKGQTSRHVLVLRHVIYSPQIAIVTHDLY